MRFLWFLIFPLTTLASDLEHLDQGLVKLVQEVEAKALEVNSMRARFVQRKETILLTEPWEATGDFYLKRPEGMRFAYDAEVGMDVIFAEQQMTAVDHGKKTVAQLPIKARRFELTSGLLTRYLGDFLGQFNVDRRTLEDGNHLTLKPRKRKLRKQMKTAELWIDGDYQIHHIKVTLQSGDIYELMFQDIQINVDLPADAFTLEVPQDYKQIDQMEYLFGVDLEM